PPGGRSGGGGPRLGWWGPGVAGLFPAGRARSSSSPTRGGNTPRRDRWRSQPRLAHVLNLRNMSCPLLPLRKNPSPQPPPRDGEGEPEGFSPLSASARGLGGGVFSPPLNSKLVV